ncbi:MAG: ABC transporter permease subunit, partial [Anaerolineae bacterium]|nr:ABC transporter permease subunit [Anaerolineae bacterium]
IRLSPEYAALLVALVLYTASHIAEITRASIQSVPIGQNEAATAVALSPYQRMRFVILPQAFRVAVPPLTNQYLNLTKNSSLAVAISYFELTKITNDLIGNGAPAPQSYALLMVIYLIISLTIAAL